MSRKSKSRKSPTRNTPPPGTRGYPVENPA
jgi:hypothetical protein